MAVINAATGKLISAVAVAPETESAVMGQPAITPTGEYLYVPNQTANTVVMIRTTTNKVVGKPITVGSRPYDTAVAPNGNLLYVSNFAQGAASSVSVINISP